MIGKGNEYKPFKIQKESQKNAGIKEEPRQLLKQVQGLELLEMNDTETCCGFGGTFAVKFESISMAMGELVYRISSQGSDSRRLGRWSTMTTTGKNELHTTIITCYCPVKGTCTGSAYVQHLKYMADHRNEPPDDMDCPRQLFGHDLKEYIYSLQNSGHQIIVMGDFNDNPNNASIKKSTTRGNHPP